MTYYLKYRPQTLMNLDNETVRTSLLKILAAKNIPHAFLFSGPKGTGKTSAARIIAKILNCESASGRPCNRCQQCLSITEGRNIDVIEIDAASHRGIDDIRSLKEAVKLSPARAKKKVYIIDEAHMLTLEAANALLKTLEEPPSHVVFILATTNPEKLIPTIHSRVTEIVFQKASEEEIVSSLKRITKGEKLTVSTETLSIIAEFSDGSFRDGAKLLEQAVSEKALHPDKLNRLLKGKSKNNPLILFKLLEARNLPATLSAIEDLIAGGLSCEKLITDLQTLGRQSLLAKLGLGEDQFPAIEKEELIQLLELLLKAGEQTRNSLIEQLPLEIAVVKWCEDQKTREAEPAEVAETAPLIENSTGLSSLKMIEEGWQKILAGVKPLNNSVEALLRAAKPLCFDGKTLTLGVYYNFHKERLEEERHKKILEEVISKILSIRTRIKCTLTEPPKKETAAVEKEEVILAENESNAIVEAAKKIFGV